MDLKAELIKFLEVNNWMSAETEDNAKAIVDVYLSIYKSDVTNNMCNCENVDHITPYYSINEDFFKCIYVISNSTKYLYVKKPLTNQCSG